MLILRLSARVLLLYSKETNKCVVVLAVVGGLVVSLGVVAVALVAGCGSATGCNELFFSVHSEGAGIWLRPVPPLSH